MIGLLFVTFFARRMFVSSILKEIYQTKFDRGEGVEKKLFKEPRDNESRVTLKTDVNNTVENF